VNNSSVLSLVIKAIDEASEVLAAVGDQADEVAAQVEEANAQMSGAADKAAEDMAAANDAAITSNDDLTASYLALTRVVAESKIAQEDAAASQAATLDVAKGGAGALGAGGLISNPYVLAGAAIVGATVLVVKSADDFQAAVTRLYSTAGETANYQQLSNAILDVAKTTGEASSQLVQAQYYISSAGYTALNGVNILKAASQAAVEENANVVDVANALTTVMHDYQAASSQAVSYQNQILEAVSLGKTTLEAFSTALPTVLQVGQKAGLTFAQIAAALATITENGTDANEAADQLRSLLLGIIDPTADASKQLRDLGLSTLSLSQELGTQGLTATLNTIMQAVAANTKGGDVLITTMQNSKVAVQDMNVELKAMPPQLQALTTSLMQGHLTFLQYRTDVEELPEGMTNLGKQFEATYNQANSFNNLISSGTNPAVETLTQFLKQLFPNINATQAVLALTGANAGTAASNTQKVSDAAKDAGANVKDWATVSQTLNVQLHILWQNILTDAIAVGTYLIPGITKATEALNKFIEVVGPELAAGFRGGIDEMKVFVDAMTGDWKGVENAWNDLVKDVSQTGVWRSAADDALAAWRPVKTFFDELGSDIAKLMGALTGKGGSFTGDLSSIGKLLNIKGAFASGVQNFSGGYAVVGEEGPELVNLPSGSSVLPSNQTQQVMGSGGPGGGSMGNVTINITGQFMGTNTEARTFATQIWQQLMTVAKSNGYSLPSIGVRPM
jgi:TP901 family phage tail tape measure protein